MRSVYIYMFYIIVGIATLIIMGTLLYYYKPDNYILKNTFNKLY